MAISKILVGTDFSDQAKVAVNRAGALAAACNAELVLCHITQEASYPMPSKLEAAELAKASQRNMQELEQLAEPFTASGVRVTLETRAGYPDEGVVGVGEDTGADLIVTGTHGRTGLARFFLGSIAEKVVRLSHTNVMVVRSCDNNAEPFHRILVPTDFSPASKKALGLALDVAAPGAQITLFHAWHYPAGTMSSAVGENKDPLAELKAEIIANGNSQGESWVSEYARVGIDLSFEQAYGPAAGAVSDRLRDSDFDLVAMGTHGYRGFRRFMLGSVAETTVRHAPCSVLVAHAENAAEDVA